MTKTPEAKPDCGVRDRRELFFQSPRQLSGFAGGNAAYRKSYAAFRLISRAAMSHSRKSPPTRLARTMTDV